MPIGINFFAMVFTSFFGVKKKGFFIKTLSSYKIRKTYKTQVPKGFFWEFTASGGGKNKKFFNNTNFLAYNKGGEFVFL